MDYEERKFEYGTRIERGEITGIGEDGYIVTGYDRENLITPEIPALNSETYAEGDRVYFFLFQDGTGAVFGKF